MKIVSFLSFFVQIDTDVIVLMDDATLGIYIPSYGDRIAVFNFCKSKKPLSKRKQGLLEKLREKIKLRKWQTRPITYRHKNNTDKEA